MLSTFFKKSARTKTILFISLSNIGDIVLTFPVFDALCEKYPEAGFGIVVSPKGRSFFEGHPRVSKVYLLEKQQGLYEKVKWLKALRRQKFDLIVDLRNSMLPFLARGHRRTRPVLFGEEKGHMREKHLRRIQAVLGEIPMARGKHALVWTNDEEKSVGRLLMGLRDFVVLAPGAADDRKRWPQEGFLKASQFLTRERGIRVVMVGDRKDAKVVQDILKFLPGGVINLVGQTSLKELALVLTRARLTLVNDSGVMHLASYLDIPTVALFGPTDPRRYGPWGRRETVVQSFSGRMVDIPVDDVITSLRKLLA